jgi:hypothetical protein
MNNDVFGMVKLKGPVMLPTTGVAKFQLTDSEAYVMTDKKALAAANITSPSLTMDFEKRRFETSLTINSNGIAPVAFQSSGSINKDGDLRGDANATGTVLDGMLSRNADQAAYVFQRDISGNQSVVGVTRWTR